VLLQTDFNEHIIFPLLTQDTLELVCSHLNTRLQVTTFCYLLLHLVLILIQVVTSIHAIFVLGANHFF